MVNPLTFKTFLYHYLYLLEFDLREVLTHIPTLSRWKMNQYWHVNRCSYLNGIRENKYIYICFNIYIYIMLGLLTTMNILQKMMLLNTWESIVVWSSRLGYTWPVLHNMPANQLQNETHLCTLQCRIVFLRYVLDSSRDR